MIHCEKVFFLQALSFYYCGKHKEVEGGYREIFQIQKTSGTPRVGPSILLVPVLQSVVKLRVINGNMIL